MNLHNVSSYFSDKDFDPELEKVYKVYSAHSHLDALEVIYMMGVQKTLDEYGERLDRLAEKYEALLSQITAKDFKIEPDPEVTKKVIAQTLDMGKVFK